MSATFKPRPSTPKLWRTGAENLSDCVAGRSHCSDRLWYSIKESPQEDYWNLWPDSTLVGTTTELLRQSEAGSESLCGSS